MEIKTPRGHIHPISSLIRQANKIFFDMGFSLAEGPLLESEWYNFDALNVPKDHPSRDMQDTFFLKTRNTRGTHAEHTPIPQRSALATGRARSGADRLQANQQISWLGLPIPTLSARNTPTLLRTHTSNVQIRYMESQIKKGIQPTYRIVSMGKVFRNEATDMGHEAEFFQIEALAVDENVTLAHLKGTLARFFKEIFSAGGGTSVEVRFRPSFFPFTEPSVEVDMRLMEAKTSSEVGSSPDASQSEAFRVSEKLRDKWMEMGGAGMVHPNVLENSGVDSKKYQGFAFGFGIDRLAMLKWGIDDIRLMHSADLRFINQF